MLSGKFVLTPEIIANPSMLYNPITLSWLPKSKKISSYPKVTENDKGIFELIQNKFINSKVVIGLLDISIPQYISAKYHHMDIELIGNSIEDEDEKYAAYMSWYAQYCATFGLEYLSDLQNGTCDRRIDIQQKKMAVNLNTKLVNNSDISSFAFTDGILLERLGKITKLDSTPPAENCIKKSIEFLLEPGILIQLPWNTVIFHQWLALAMLDVLTFEKYTLELREWPVLRETLSYANDLLLQLRTLKERIMLGFLIHCQQIQMYPNPKYPEMIMDKVVMPSLPTLAFIQPGKEGHKILQSIKLTIWSQSEVMNDEWSKEHGFLDRAVYTVNKTIEAFFENTCYGLRYWLESIPMGFYNPIYKPENIEIESIIKHIGEVIHCDIPDKSNTRQLLMNQMEQIEYNSAIKVLLETIEREIFKKGRLPKEKLKEVKTYIKSSDTDDVGTLVDGALIFNKSKSYLCEHEKETGILRRIILLQLEILEREAMLSLTTKICVISEIAPLDINTKKYKIMPLCAPEIKALLTKNYNSTVVAYRDSFWLQNKEWLKRINVNESQLILVNKPLPHFFKECSDRVGRIIVNIACELYEMLEKGGVIYPHLLTVQYLLPCYVSILIGRYVASKDTIIVQRTLALIHGLLQYYEQSAVEWSTNIIIRRSDDFRCWTKEKLLETVRTQGNTLKSLLAHSNVILTAHLNSTDPYKHFFDQIEMSILQWHDNEIMFDKAFPGYKYSYIWLLKGTNVIKELDHICMKSWNYPNEIHLKKLHYNELYELDDLMSFFILLVQGLLAIVVNNENPSNHRDNLISQVTVAVNMYNKELLPWRLQFIKESLSPLYENMTASNVNKTCKNGIELFKTLYCVFTDIRPLLPDKYINEDRSWGAVTPKQYELQKLFFNSNITKLCELLFGFVTNTQDTVVEGNGDCTENVPVNADKVSETSVNDGQKCKSTKKASKANTKIKKCRNCWKIEIVKNELIVCKKCIEDKYPDVNYFCNEECEASWWNTEHMAEHLEFELGLLNLN